MKKQTTRSSDPIIAAKQVMDAFLAKTETSVEKKPVKASIRKSRAKNIKK